MKKIITLLLLFSIIANSQISTPNWSTQGITATSSHWLGTRNNQPIIFKVNNVEVFRASTGGLVFANGKILSTEDFTTSLKSKLEALPTNPITGSGTATRVPFFSSTSALTSASEFTFDNTNKALTVGALNDNTTRLTVNGAIKGNANGGSLLFTDGLNNQVFRSLQANFGVAFTNHTYFQMGSSDVALTGVNGVKMNTTKMLTDAFQISNGTNVNTPSPVGLFEIRSATTPFMNVLANGNVGIGTTTASFPLDIQGENTGINLVRSGGADAFLRMQAGTASTTISQIRSTATGNLNFSTNDTATRLTITQAGNIGINTTAPTEKLHVIGNTLNENGFITVRNPNTNQFRIDPMDGVGPKLKLGTVADPVAFFEMGAYNSQNNLDNKARDFQIFGNGINGIMLKNTTGNVGIGTTTPGAELQVMKTNATTSLFIGNNASNRTYGFIKTSADTNGYLEISSVRNSGAAWGDIALNPNGGSVSSFVGIGKTAPSEKLDVAGNIRFSGALMPNNSAGTPGQVLVSSGTGNAPFWQSMGSNMIVLQSDVVLLTTWASPWTTESVAEFSTVSIPAGKTISLEIYASITSANTGWGLSLENKNFATGDFVNGEMTLANFAIPSGATGGNWFNFYFNSVNYDTKPGTSRNVDNSFGGTTANPAQMILRYNWTNKTATAKTLNLGFGADTATALATLNLTFKAGSLMKYTIN